MLDSEGEPLRLGAAAEPYLVSPNQAEAESLVGQELTEDQEVVQALEDIAELGAAERPDHARRPAASRSCARSAAPAKRYRVAAPRVEALSAVGAGDVLLAGFLAARFDERPRRGARSARPWPPGAASTLEIGAGRFEPA